MKFSAFQLYEYGAAIMVAVASGLVGSFALLKRMTLASDVVSHLALPGIGIAIVYRFNPVLGAAATLLVGTFFIWGLEEKTGIATEAVIGVVFAAALAAGALIMPREDLAEALFGTMQPLGPAGFVLASLAALTIVVGILSLKHRLVLAIFSEDLAATSGVRTKQLNLIFLVLFSLTILVSLKFLGALLSSALLMVPAATGRRMANGVNSLLVYSTSSSVVAVLAGLALSSMVPRLASPGPVIVLVAATIFMLTSIKTR